MKFNYLLFLGLIALTYQIKTEDHYAPWTKSKITNNTPYSLFITTIYTNPSCQDLSSGSVSNPSKDARGKGCYKEFTEKFTLKTGKTVTVGQEKTSADIEGNVDRVPSGEMMGNTLIVELTTVVGQKTQKQLNVAPIKITNPAVKHYKINFDGKNLKVEQSPL